MTWFRSSKADSVKRSPGAQLNLPKITDGIADKLGTISASQGVFLVHTKKGEFFVLKREREGFSPQSEFSPATAMMGLVQKIRAEALTPEEVKIIQKWKVPGNQDWAKAVLQSGGATTEFWTKSTYVPKEKNLKIAGKGQLNDMDEDEKKEKLAQLMKLAKRLSDNRRAWEQLGEIAAVDNFNGNQDRFYFMSGGYNAGNMYIQNFGNVMFREKAGTFGIGKTIRAVGLDAFDPNAAKIGHDQTWDSDFKPFLQASLPQQKQDINAALENIYQYMKDMIEKATGADLDWKKSNLEAMKKGYFAAIESMKDAVKSGKVKLSDIQKKKVAALKWA